MSFHATREKLLPRPWAVDHMDALLDRLCRCPPSTGCQHLLGSSVSTVVCWRVFCWLPVGQPGRDGPTNTDVVAPSCRHAVLCSHTYKRAVLFVDNSGADIILGEQKPPASKLTSRRAVQPAVLMSQAAG